MNKLFRKKDFNNTVREVTHAAEQYLQFLNDLVNLIRKDTFH